MGESAGATIAHNMAVRVGTANNKGSEVGTTNNEGLEMGATSEGLEGFHVCGAVLVHPYFASDRPNEMMQFMYPGSSGTDRDPMVSPKADPDPGKMGCEKVLVFVAENDLFGLRPIGVEYCERLRHSGWKGEVELVENYGEDHVFHLMNPTCENAVLLIRKVASFVSDGCE